MNTNTLSESGRTGSERVRWFTDLQKVALPPPGIVLHCIGCGARVDPRVVLPPSGTGIVYAFDLDDGRPAGVCTPCGQRGSDDGVFADMAAFAAGIGLTLPKARRVLRKHGIFEIPTVPGTRRDHARRILQAYVSR